MLDLGLEEPLEWVDGAGRSGKRSPATGIEFEFASGREEFAAEVEVEVEVGAEATNVFIFPIPKKKEKQGLVARRMKKD